MLFRNWFQAKSQKIKNKKVDMLEEIYQNAFTVSKNINTERNNKNKA